MSGGSFNYLYGAADNCELSHRLQDLRAMVDELPKGSLARANTQRVVDLLVEAVERALELSDVWHAVEWKCSGDSGDEQIVEALAKYNKAAEGTP